MGDVRFMPPVVVANDFGLGKIRADNWETPVCKKVEKGLRREREEGETPISRKRKIVTPLVTREEEKYGLFFPSRRKTIMGGVDLGDVSQEPGLGDDFFEEKPVFDTLHGIEEGWAMKTNRLEVKDILSMSPYLVTKDGKHVITESLKGNFVLFACIFAPVSSEYTLFCRTLSSLSDYYTKCGVHNVKVVIVAKMRQNWVHDKDAFDHLLSGFPPNFLAIPFSDTVSREYVAKSMGLSSFDHGAASALVVDPYHFVFPQNFAKLVEYGAASFPFHPPHYHYYLLAEHDRSLQYRFNSFPMVTPSFNPAFLFDKSPITLVQLLSLCCPEVDLHLLRIMGPRTTERVPLSVLDGKIVALYLCVDGLSMERFHNDLQKIVKDCNAQLEVVLVPLSFIDDPDVFLDHATLALQKHGISSWWALPYHDILCHTLSRAKCARSDRLLLLPFQDCYSGDIKAFSTALHRNRMYDSAQHLLYSIRMFATCKINFVSLLGTEHTEFCWSGDFLSPFKVKNLRDKNILLYIDTFQPDSYSQDISNLIRKYHSKLQLEYPDFLLINVPTMGTPDSDIVCKHTGLVLPTEVADSVSKALFFEDLGEHRRNAALVSVGKDGRILSRMAQDILSKGDIVSLFNWNLNQEIARDVENEFEDI